MKQKKPFKGYWKSWIRRRLHTGLYKKEKTRAKHDFGYFVNLGY